MNVRFSGAGRFGKFISIMLAVVLLLIALPVFAYLPTDPLYAQQDYLDQINIEPAWDLAKGKEVTVAVIDSGVYINHPDLKFNIWKNSSEIDGDGLDNDQNGYVDDINGWDFVANEPDPQPKVAEGYNLYGMNHGTIVAGIIAAVGNNNKGITGLAFNAKIMPLRILDAQGNGNVANLIKAIEYAVNNGADIINLSLVGFTASHNLEQALKWANEQGVVVVVSAGNTNSDNQPINLDEQLTYPACYGDNISQNWVVAVSSVDKNDYKSSFASYGDCVDVMAPGEDIISTSFHSDEVEDFNGYYVTGWNGTSLSAAVVSGVAALIKSKDKTLSATEVINALTTGVVDISGKNLKYRNKLGRGRIDAFKALEAVANLANGYLAKLADKTAVYYIDTQNRRHLFSNEATFWTWYNGSWADQVVKVVSQDEFDNFKIGNNITARAGVDLIKFENSPRLYAVQPKAELCWVDKNALTPLFGDNWEKRVSVIQDSFEADYHRDVGCKLTAEDHYLDGTLIQYKNSNDVWYIDGGHKRRVVNEAFAVNEFKESRIITEVDPVMDYPTGRLIEGLDPKIFIYNK